MLGLTILKFKTLCQMETEQQFIRQLIHTISFHRKDHQKNSIAPGGTLLFRANYLITQSDILSGEIINSVRVSGSAFNYDDGVYDYSDDGDDQDDNIVDDPTEISLQGEFISNIEIFELVTPIMTIKMITLS